MTTSVLFVCLGNICRSPTAEGVFRKLVATSAKARAIDVRIDSAGTAAWHVGKSPDQRSQRAALARGYDLSSLRARQVTDQDFQSFDYILAMDEENLANLQSMPGAQTFGGHLGLLLDFAKSDLRNVPDPYYGGVDGFNQVLDLIEDASSELLSHLRHNPSPSNI